MSRNKDTLLYQRIDLFMQHIPRFWIDGAPKLARDAGVPRSTLHDVLRCRHVPSYRVAVQITEALSRALGTTLHCDDVLSFTGSFSRSVCDICGCRCLPDAAYNHDGSRKAEYAHLVGGDWETVPYASRP
jgi:hypothetical protein